MKSTIIVLLVLAMANVTSTSFATIIFRGIGDLPGGGFSSRANGVSADGSIVLGSSKASAGYHAFKWTSSGGMVNLGDLPGGKSFSVAYEVSNDGSVIVGRSVGSSGGQACIWQDGVITPIADTEYAYAISADGSQVTGYGYFSNNSSWDGYRWENGVTTRLGSIDGARGANVLSRAYDISADGSVVVGMASSPSGGEAFRWTETGGMIGLGGLPGETGYGTGKAVSADGAVIVGSTPSGSKSYLEAFRWEDGIMTGLGMLPPYDGDRQEGSEAFDVNADGSVVVGTSNYKGFIWDEDNGIRDVMEVLENYGIDLTGWYIMDVTGISNDGLTFVGNGINPDGYGEGWIASVLGPTTLEIAVDIKPGSCPNPLRVNFIGNGVYPVAIVGSADFDVTTIDPDTVTLIGVPVLRSKVGDVSTSSSGGVCTTSGPDGIPDLVLKFRRSDIIAALENLYGDITEIPNREELTLTLLAETYEGESVTGTDTLVVLNRGAIKRKK